MNEALAVIVIAVSLTISFILGYRRNRQKGMSKVRSFFWG